MSIDNKAINSTLNIYVFFHRLLSGILRKLLHASLADAYTKAFDRLTPCHKNNCSAQWGQRLFNAPTGLNFSGNRMTQLIEPNSVNPKLFKAHRKILIFQTYLYPNWNFWYPPKTPNCPRSNTMLLSTMWDIQNLCKASFADDTILLWHASW